jgi:hypothetical protein
MVTNQTRSCFNCIHLRGDTYGDNFHEPIATDYYCNINGNLNGEDEFVSITDDEWDELSSKSEEYINQYIAEKCSKYKFNEE